MAKEYIEREAVKKYPIRLDHYDKKNGNLDFVLGIESVLEYVDDIPAADVVEVRYGEWIEEEFESYIPVEVDITGNLVVHKHTIYKCSICSRTEPQKEPYCHCGAKMNK